MAMRYKASQRQFVLSCGLAAIACVGTWLTAFRFHDAWGARGEARTSEAILNGCRDLTVSLQNLEQKTGRVLGAGSTADLMAFRSAQQAWHDQTNALWSGVRLDPDALRTFGDLVITVQRWQDRSVEAKLAGAPVSTMSPMLFQTASQRLDELIAIEKGLYANRLAHRTAPAKDFVVFGMGTLLLMAAAAYGLRRDLMRRHFDQLDQLSLSASDLLDGEGLVAPPKNGGAELDQLSRTVHQLGLRYMSVRGEHHHLHNLLTNLSELGHLRQTRPPIMFYTAFAEQVTRQVEARSGAIVVMDDSVLRLVSQYGDTGSESLQLYMRDLLTVVQTTGDMVIWSESNQFPEHLRAALIDHRCHAIMAAPLWDMGTINGMVIVWHGAGRPWPASLVAYLKAAAGLIDIGQAAGVPANSPVRGILGERIAEARDAKQRQWALDQALHEAVSPFDGVMAELLLVQPDGRTLNVAVARGLPAAEWDSSRCLLGEGLAGHAEVQGRWQEISNVDGTMHLLTNPYIRQWAPKAIALAPLPRLGSIRGVLVLYSKQAAAFNSAEPHLIGIASQIALGLQSALGEAVAVEASHAWDTVADLSHSVQDCMTVTAVATAWNNSIREAFSTHSSAIYLLNDSNVLHLAGAHGVAVERLTADACQTIASRTSCGSDCTSCGHASGSGHLCIPLIWQERAIGMATIQGPSSSYWTPTRTRLAQVMADLATFGVIAVRAANRESSSDRS